MLDAKTLLIGCVAYLRENPNEIFNAAQKAVRGRFGLPIAALRWLSTHFESSNGPRDIEIEASPPGLRVSATIEEMNTLLRGSAVVSVVAVEISKEALRVEVRLADVSLKLLDDKTTTPLSALIRSGALDLTRVANLVAHMPKRPVVLVDVIDDRLVLDFMRLPRFANDESLRKIVGAVAQLLKVDGIRTDESHVELALRAFPNGVSQFFR
jgi:hypothetical protein